MVTWELGVTYSQVTERAWCTKTSTEQRWRLSILPVSEFHPSLLKGHFKINSAGWTASISAYLATMRCVWLLVRVSLMPGGKNLLRLVLWIPPYWHLSFRIGWHSLTGAEPAPSLRSPTKGRVHKSGLRSKQQYSKQSVKDILWSRLLEFFNYSLQCSSKCDAIHSPINNGQWCSAGAIVGLFRTAKSADPMTVVHRYRHFRLSWLRSPPLSLSNHWIGKAHKQQSGPGFYERRALRSFRLAWSLNVLLGPLKFFFIWLCLGGASFLPYQPHGDSKHAELCLLLLKILLLFPCQLDSPSWNAGFGHRGSSGRQMMTRPLTFALSKNCLFLVGSICI